MLARKWLNADVSCCLTEANKLSNMQFYLEKWPDVPQESLSVAGSIVKQWNDKQFVRFPGRYFKQPSHKLVRVVSLPAPLKPP